MNTISINYNNQQYKMLVHRFETITVSGLRVTVMNGELEKLLIGYSRFHLYGSRVTNTNEQVPADRKGLIESIIIALEGWLRTEFSGTDILESGR